MAQIHTMTLAIGDTLKLPSELKVGRQLVFHSSTLHIAPRSTVVDNTAINLLTASGDYLLHISIRCLYNIIIFNSRQALGGWGGEERIAGLEAIFGSGEQDAKITVYESATHFIIVINGVVAHLYQKRLSGVATHISYGSNEANQTPFNNVLHVQLLGNNA